MQLSDYVVSGMHDNVGTLEQCVAKGEESRFYRVQLSDYVVSGMHDNVGTLERTSVIQLWNIVELDVSSVCG